MLFRLFCGLTLLLALAGCNRESYSRSNTGYSALDKKVLYDFRSPGRTVPIVDRNTTNQVLSAILPSFVPGSPSCKSSDSPQTAPTILGSTDGSFTAAGLKQTAYLIEVRECGRKSALTTRRLAVFTGAKLMANMELPYGNSILGTYDLNGDGKNELLLEGGGTGQGEIIQSAMLIELDRDKLVVLEDFGQIYDSTCNTDLKSKFLTAHLVAYLPPPAGQKPKFTVKLYRAPCPATGEQPHWTAINEK